MQDVWWVREAGEPAPLAPLSAHVSADVVIVGGGYLGMWTAWQLSLRGASVVLLERDRCGFGPSGRNGGFVNGYWDKLPALVDRFGSDAAVRLCHAADSAVIGIGSFCSDEGVDAWYRPAPHIEIASTPAQSSMWEEAVSACASRGLSAHYSPLSASEVAAHAWSPRFGGGAAMPAAATVQPARLAFGLRQALLDRGVRVFENSRVTRVSDEGVETGGGSVSASRVVLAVNHVAGGLRPFRRMVSTASSHIVLTAPAPEVLERIGWTDGSALCDCRTMLHYFRTTPDGRIAFGWGGGRMGYGSRRRPVLDADADAAARAERNLRRFFPSLCDVPIEAAWGGPIDVSPIRVPQYREAGRAVAGFGFTGNGVGPSYLGGQILTSMALDERDEFTSLPVVEPEVPLFPPEPLRFVGASAIRAAMVRDDDNADAGRTSSPPVRFVAGLPRRLGMSLPR